jgi:hypothetical protein
MGFRWPHPDQNGKWGSFHVLWNNAREYAAAWRRGAAKIQTDQDAESNETLHVCLRRGAACALLGVLPGTWQAAVGARVARSRSKSSCRSIGESCDPVFWNACQDYEARCGV